MANYSAIKAVVNAYIKRNGRKEITGSILNAILNSVIDSLGRYFQFAGGAMPSVDPGTPDQNVCYLATEPGVYTHFGEITIEEGEVAFLFYNGEWTKQRVLIGIQEVEASVDNQVGTPSVDVSYSQGRLVLTFHNLKGEQGIQGETGASAGFGTIGADITGGVGTPGVSVETSGQNTAKNIMFHFTNLKGETGVTSVIATIDNTSGTPSCQVSLVGQQLTLAFSGLKGVKGDTGVSADYPITIYNGLDSDATDQALAAAQGKLLMRNIKLIYDSLGAGAFWGEKPVIDWTGNSVPVSITLENCSIDNQSSFATLGDPYSATITPNSGNILASAVCTMGGTPVPVVNGIISIAEVTGSIVISAVGTNLDSVAFDGKTYRQIFETNNLLGISPGFEDGSYSPLIVGAGTPSVTNEDSDSGEYSLKAFGTSSQQVKTSSLSYKNPAFVGCRVKVTRYVSGYAGVQYSSDYTIGQQAVTDWKTITYDKSGVSSNGVGLYVGSWSSANLDCYVDTPVVVYKSIFSTAPTLEQFTELYERYVAIKKAA